MKTYFNDFKNIMFNHLNIKSDKFRSKHVFLRFTFPDPPHISLVLFVLEGKWRVEDNHGMSEHGKSSQTNRDGYELYILEIDTINVQR